MKFEFMGPSYASRSIIKHQHPNILNHFDWDSLQPMPLSLRGYLFKFSPGLASMAPVVAGFPCFEP